MTRATPADDTAIVQPDLPIVDSHHHLWLRPGIRYLLDEFAADAASGHKVIASVYVECGEMARRSGPEALRPVGEAEFVAGMAAMSDSGLSEAARVVESHAHAADARLRGIRHFATHDAGMVARFMHCAPSGLLADGAFRRGAAGRSRRRAHGPAR